MCCSRRLRIRRPRSTGWWRRPCSDKPSRLEDVAQVYGRLFAKVGTNTTLLLQRRSKADGPQDLDDPAMTELVQTPYQVPTYAEIATSEAQEAYLAPKPGRRSGQGPLPMKRQDAEHVPVSRHQPAATDASRCARARNGGGGQTEARGQLRPHPWRSGETGPVVPRRTLEILGGADRKPFKQGGGRLELARSITDPRNPLTARVLVNRVWMYHFGRGLVPTPDDLGTMSEAPSHPELLDYLAAEFVEKRWALKPLHKRILMSAAYQQSSETRPDYQAKGS